VRHAFVPALVIAIWAAVPAAGTPADQKAIRSRHQALVGALNRKDLKAARTYYAPDYRAEVAGAVVGLNRHLASLSEMSSGGAGVTRRATLERIVVRGAAATAVENAVITMNLPGGVTQKIPAQRSRQGWKKIGGVWKLAWEQALVTPAAAPAKPAPKPKR
jgi:ketosteroid isomerase-like protein